MCVAVSKRQVAVNAERMLASGAAFDADCVRRTPQHGWGAAPGVLTQQFWDFYK